MGIERRELAQLIRDSNDQDASKLDALAGLDELAVSLGFDNPRELAEYLGVSRSELAQLVQESDTPNELAEALGYDNAAALAEELGVDRSELAQLLDSAKSSDELAEDDIEESPANSDSDEESAAGVSQETEQEAQSGEVRQSFTVTGGGDNSNQSTSVQGTANTGNAQNQVAVEQVDSSAEDIEIDGGSSIEVSPEQDAQSQQEVQQAASAAEPEVQQATPGE